MRDRIKEYLKARGLSQEEFAWRAGVSFATVNCYLSGKIKPHAATLDKIERVLNEFDLQRFGRRAQWEPTPVKESVEPEPPRPPAFVPAQVNAPPTEAIAPLIRSLELEYESAIETAKVKATLPEQTAWTKHAKRLQKALKAARALKGDLEQDEFLKSLKG